MNDTSPFRSPDHDLSSVEPSNQVRRPNGTFLIALLSFLGGAFLLWDRVSLLRLLTDPNTSLDPTSYPTLTREVITSATGLLGGIGLLFSRPFGWWLAVVHWCWRFTIEVVLPLLGAFLSGSVNPGLIPKGLLFALIIAYMQKSNVMSFFHIRWRRGIVLCFSLLASFGVGLMLDAWWTAMS